VFLHLKTFLGGRQLHDDEVKEALNTWFESPVMQGYKNLCPATTSTSTMVKLSRKVVYGMYIKWQYKWSGNKFFVFLIAHRNLLAG
jgi:hypothetical protein